MKAAASKELLKSARSWDDLSRFERAELGRALRRLGWTYGEIMQVIPVPKGTLAYWCREIRLAEEQIEAIAERTGSRQGVPQDTQRRRREEVERIRSRSCAEVPDLINDPLWLAGTVLYWAEGAKTRRMLALSNSDPRALRIFIDWCRRFHDASAGFVLQIHLHEGNDDSAARRYWGFALQLDNPDFHKSFIKAKGTGHRKNHLSFGVCRVRMRRSANAWVRTMAWVDSLSDVLDSTNGADAILAPGR